MAYKKVKESTGNISTLYIKRESDNARIPTKEGNTDYQEYLRWVKIDGNKIKDAD